MARDSTIQHQPNRLVRNASEKRKSSSRKHIYDLKSTSTPSRLVIPQQLRNRPLKTYTSSKLRTITTYSFPNTPNIHAEPSLTLQLGGAREGSHPYVAHTAKLRGNGEANATRPTTEPVRTNLKRADERVRERLKCSASKEEIEQALRFTPNPQRYKRRREAKAAVLKAGAEKPSAVVARTKIIERTIARPQITKKALNRDQEGGLQNFNQSGENIPVEEPVRGARQKLQLNLSFQSHYEISAANIPQHEDLEAILHAEHKNEDEEEADESTSQDNNEHDHEQQLDELDKEILNLRGNHEGSVDDEACLQSTLSPQSPKRPRPADNDLSNVYDVQKQIDDEYDEEYEHPTLKKKSRKSCRNLKAEARDANLQELKSRRASKQPHISGSTKIETKARKPAQAKKKKRRSLPVNKLVLVSERFDDPDIEVNEETPPELLEDPISQLSISLEDSRPRRNGKKSCRKLDINMRPGKGFGTIHISEYRLPKSKVEPPGQLCKASSHSDGFAGHEAMPTGIFMPVHTQHRRQQTWHKLTVKIGELTLVAERDFGESVREEQSRVSLRKKQAKKHCRQLRGNNDIMNQRDDPLVIGYVKGQALGAGEVYQCPLNELFSDTPEQSVDEEASQHQQNALSPRSPKQSTPHMTPGNNTVLEPPSRNSPLGQKGRLRKVTFQDEANAAQREPQVDSLQPGGPFRRGDSKEVSVSQQPRIISTTKKASMLQKKEIEVLQQLMMVSIPRSSLQDSDSEDDSENENVEAENDSSEEGTESSEEERSDTPEEDSEEGDAESDDEFRVEEDGMETLNRKKRALVLPRTSGHIRPLRPSKIEAQIPIREVKKPTLRREDAQSPILKMSPQHLPDGVSTSQRSAALRQFSRLQEQQILYSEQLLLDSVDRMIINEPEPKGENEHSRRIPALARDSSNDDSWRPREPVINSVRMEVEGDEIVDSSSPLAAHVMSSNQRTASARPLSRMVSQTLALVASRPASPQKLLPNSVDSQGSIELGDTQRLLRSAPNAYIPETQCSEINDESEEDDYKDGGKAKADIPTSQLIFVQESNDYFQRAPQSFQEPIQKLNLVRRKSLPASMHVSRRPDIDEDGMMARSITMTTAFQRMISNPSQSKSHGASRGTLMTATRGHERSLRVLTRQASMELGTLPPSAKRRMVSLPFVPPFKKPGKTG